jgi:hypothetical protein
MPRQFSDAVRNNWGDGFETIVGTSPRLELRTGAPPANCAAADSGTLLATINLPADWLNAASAGSKTLLGTWQANAGAAGTAGHYRIKNTAGTVTHEQGNITATGGGGDMTLDNTSIANGQQVTVTAYALTLPGA